MEQSLTHSKPRQSVATTGSIDLTAVREGVYKLTSPVLMALFFLSLSIPVPFEIGTTRLSPDRLFLVLLFIPIVIRWVTRKAGPVTRADVLFGLFGFWIVVCLLKHHGFARFPYASVTLIEVFGSYLLGRILIRNIRDFKVFMTCYFAMLALMMPFVIPEFITSEAYLLEIFRDIFGSSFKDLNHPPRLGFERAQGVFEHPILFGVFCSLGLANAIFIWHHSKFKARMIAGLSLFMAFMSLSSGAFLAALAQVLLVLWGKITGNKWKLGILLVTGIYVFLTLASNRGPIILLIETLAFNSNTGWTRIVQYNHGSAEALANPIFGIGLNNWRRPWWLGPSVDNFWLLMAMRYGLVGFGFLVGAIFFHIRRIVMAAPVSRETAFVRTGYIIGLTSVILSMGTVHVWGGANAFIMAYIGAGAWIYTQPPAPSNDEGADNTPQETANPTRATFGGNRKTATSYNRSALPKTPARVRQGGQSPYTRGTRKD